MTEIVSNFESLVEERLNIIEVRLSQLPRTGPYTNRLIRATKHEYQCSLIVVIKDEPSVWYDHDETIICKTIAEAREKMTQIQERTTENKRRILICQQIQESKNFGEFR